MSISASLSSFEWDDRKINLIDTPGEPSFVADSLGALRVCESAIFVVNAVMGVEVNAIRLWQRAEELDLARMLFVNMLDRERADFFRTLESLKAAFGPHVVATEIPIGSEHEIRGVIDLVDMKAYEYEGDGRDNAREIPIPDELAGAGRRSTARSSWTRSPRSPTRSWSATSRARRSPTRRSSPRSRTAPTTAGSSRCVCGVATKNLGTNRLLDAIVEDLPSPGEARRPSSCRRSRSSPTRTRSCSPTSSRRGPTRSRAGSTSSASTRA